MKDFQQNLLILLALGLCGLCVFQWRSETAQRAAIEQLNQVVYERAVAIQGYTNSIRTMDQQIAQLDATISELKSAAQTNQLIVLEQRREIHRLAASGYSLTNQITEYKQAIQTLETKLKEAYEGVKKQNDAVQELVTQRDDLVKKYNQSVSDRNDVVAKYNELVQKVEKLQNPAKP